MSTIMLRITVAIAVLFSVIAVGARTAQSTPDDQTVTTTPVEKAQPTRAPSEAPRAIESVEELLPGSQAQPMTCTGTPSFCETTCRKLHHCEGFCNPRGGCTCVGTPPCGPL